MEAYVWLLPLIFVFHSLEEIIGFGLWLKGQTEEINKKYPFIFRRYRYFTTESFTINFTWQLIVLTAICAIGYLTNNNIVWAIWMGGLFALMIHFGVHIFISILFNQYVPSLITSILGMPILIWLAISIFKTSVLSDIIEIVFIFIGLLFFIANYFLAKWIMKKFFSWQNKEKA